MSYVLKMKNVQKYLLKIIFFTNILLYVFERQIGNYLENLYVYINFKLFMIPLHILNAIN